MNKNSLVEIPFEDWPNLRDLYKNRKFESNSFNTIQNYIDWINKDPSLKDSLKFYSLNADWSDGTFIIEDHQRYVMMNTLEDSQKRLLEALHCLDKKAHLVLSGCPLRIKNTIETYLMDLGIKKESLRFSTTIWHHIEMNKALEFNIDPPKGISLSALRKDDIDLINSEWPHQHSGSELFVGRLVTLNQNIGAYDENGKLIAWCLLLQIGALGLLQVLDSYKRKGFGGLMIRTMAKMNATKGIETMAPVVEENTASRALFKSLGFQEIDKVYWFDKPSIE